MPPAQPTSAPNQDTPCHDSLLLQKLKQHGLVTPKEMAAAAIDRGCDHYTGFAGDLHKDAPGITDEELAIALLSCVPYAPQLQLIRIGSQMLSGQNSDPLILARLAIMEKCESTLQYIAECGKKTEPGNPFWQTILDELPECSPFPKHTVHISRFRIEVGVVDPRTPDAPKIVWLRPTSATSRNLTDREIFLLRREAKWQFRRGLLLCSADILEKDTSGEAWEKINKSIKERQANPDQVIRMLARNWKKRMTSQAALIQYIRDKFEQDTPEGPPRHKLQAQSEGHPFAAILPETARSDIYRQAYQALQ